MVVHYRGDGLSGDIYMVIVQGGSPVDSVLVSSSRTTSPSASSSSASIIEN